MSGTGSGGDGIHRGTDTTSGSAKVPLDDGSKPATGGTKPAPAAGKKPDDDGGIHRG
jgi:hypothetical protein